MGNGINTRKIKQKVQSSRPAWMSLHSFFDTEQARNFITKSNEISSEFTKKVLAETIKLSTKMIELISNRGPEPPDWDQKYTRFYTTRAPASGKGYA